MIVVAVCFTVVAVFHFALDRAYGGGTPSNYFGWFYAGVALAIGAAT